MMRASSLVVPLSVAVAALATPGAEARTVDIREWRPWRIQKPRDGKYTLRMVLVDAEGRPVPGPVNDTTREFTVSTSAPAPADHPHPKEPGT